MLNSYDINVQTFCSAQYFLDTVDLTKPGCAVVDCKMPEISGQQLHQILLDKNSPISVIFLTGHGDVPMAVNALKLGVLDFFQKPVNGDRLVESIKKGLDESKNKSRLMGRQAQYESLSIREKEVVALLSKGYRNQKIASAMCISLRTVEVHRSSILKKLNASTIADLMLNYGQFIDS
jgi:two-component system response regulator TtrR